MADLKIPPSVEHVTSQWLTAALRSTGVINGSAVTSFDFEHMGAGQGFAGQVARLRLTYDSPELGAPQSMIAKFPATDPSVRAALNGSGMYECEVRFYGELAPEVELSTPQCFYRATDREAGDHVLLLEDLAPARVGDGVAGCSDEDAELAVREIARFHAALWESPRLVTLEWMFNFHRDADTKQELYKQRWPLFLEKLGHLLSPSLLEIGQRLKDNLAHISRRLGEPPSTVVHGDYRLENMVFETASAGAPLTVIDWQRCEIGRGVADVAYLVAVSMEPERRRATELGLLRDYHSVLLAQGVEGYDFGECLIDYRLSLLHHMQRLVTAFALVDISSERAQVFARGVIQRFDSAFTDHNVAELMPA